MAQLEIERVSQCQRIEKQQLLLGINRELGISLVPGQFRREISAMSAKACEAQRCIIYVVDKEDENRIFPLHLLGAQEENYPTRHPKPGKATEVGECLHIQQYSLLQELFNQKNVHEYRVEDMGIPDTWNRSFGDGYVLCVPLVCRARCIGLLTLFRRPDRFIDAQKEKCQ